jgi:hypothetical protein
LWAAGKTSESIAMDCSNNRTNILFCQDPIF